MDFFSAVGFIPTRAGKMCLTDGSIQVYGGSSPLARGKYTSYIHFLHTPRFIPTRAGKMPGVVKGEINRGVHPHSRGENGLLWVNLDQLRGSSPLARGKL